jgi:hypothetical protein
MSRHNITHITEIQAPIEFVWKTLFDLDDWKNWNKWTLISTKDPSVTPKQGVPGILKVCYEGDDQNWQTYDFVFGEILHENHLLTWQGAVAGGCLFSGHHTMRLEGTSPNETNLTHAEQFGGMLPMMGVGLPYKTMNRNYLLMNESFKAHVEQQFKESQ